MTAPDIEHYIRCSVTVGQWTVEPGIEFRDGDDESELASGIETLANFMANDLRVPEEKPMDVSKTYEPSFRSRWPGRAFFIEIHSPGCKYWTQVFQPYGVPQRQPDPLSNEPNLWRDLYGELCDSVNKIHETLGGGEEELAEDAAKRVAATMHRQAERLNTVHQTLGGMLGENVEDAAKRVVSERDFYSRKVYDAVDSARRAKDERDACREETEAAQMAAIEARSAVQGLQDQLDTELRARLRARCAHLASLDSWRTQAQVLGNQVLAARDAIDGRNADTLTDAIDRLRSELGASDSETLRQAALRVLTERDAAVSRLEGV